MGKKQWNILMEYIDNGEVIKTPINFILQTSDNNLLGKINGVTYIFGTSSTFAKRQLVYDPNSVVPHIRSVILRYRSLWFSITPNERLLLSSSVVISNDGIIEDNLNEIIEGGLNEIIEDREIKEWVIKEVI